METRLITSNMINEERLSNNEETVSKEEECNHYKQRCKVLMALNERHRADLAICRRKIQGIDSLTVLLKDSRQENCTLCKNNKSLQSAVNNLQRRLSKNGLSASPSLQDTELLIPGASKQTIDKLAKENMRLRKEKKSTDELEEMKIVNEKLESENNLLKQDIETYKQKVTELSKERDEEKELIQENHMQSEANDNKQLSNGESVMRVSVGCQASDLKTDTVSELKELLKLTVRHCSRLEDQLQQSSETSQISEGDKTMDSNLKAPVLVDEDYQKLKTQLGEAQIMNQRWQDYCQMQSKHIQALNVNIESLNTTVNSMEKEQEDKIHAAAHQEERRLNAAIGSKDSEIQELRKQTIGLSKDNQELRGQVEIYRQQIRVCTEDFNTERKDREQAVNKAKALQDANLKLRDELDRLKLLNNAELMNRHPFHANQQSVPQRRYEFVQERGPSGQIMPGNELGYNMTQAPLSMLQPALPIPRVHPLSPHIQSDYKNARLRNPVPECGPPQNPRNVESHSLPRQLFNDPNLDGVNVAMEGNNSWKNVSMPPIGGRLGSGQEQLLACPKCNKEFPEKSSADLLTHIDMCNA